MDSGAWQYSAYDFTVKAATRVPGFRPVTPSPDRLDHAGRFHPGRVGQLGLHHVGALAEARVGEVHADGVDLDEHHAGPHVGLGHVGQGQHLRTTGLREDDRSHLRLPRRRRPIPPASRDGRDGCDGEVVVAGRA